MPRRRGGVCGAVRSADAQRRVHAVQLQFGGEARPAAGRGAAAACRRRRADAGAHSPRPQINEYFSPLAGATPVNTNNEINKDAFDSTECLGSDITTYKTGTTVIGTNPQTYNEWLFVDPALSDSAFASRCNTQATLGASLGQAPTCATLCARRNKKCNPCAIALASCQNNLYYALGQAGVNTAQIAKKQQLIATATDQPPENRGQFAFEPFPVGPWTQTTCPGAGVGSTSSLAGQQWGPYPGVAGTYRCVNGQFTNLAGGSTSGADDTQSFFGRPPNFWQPNQPNYVDPSTLCDVPVWNVLPDGTTVNLGALCYCSSAEIVPPG